MKESYWIACPKCKGKMLKVREDTKIIEYMDKGNDVSVENIILLSLHLKNERNKLEKHFCNKNIRMIFISTGV